MDLIALDWAVDVTAHYAGLPVQPLLVTLELHNGMVQYDPLNLDNLLAHCVVDRATEGRGLPDVFTGGYDLPVPLHCLWRDANGFPLWAATPFVPEGESVRDVSYTHKRAITGQWTGTKRGTVAIQAGAGRHADRRIPLPVIVAERWTATCIGNMNEIGVLLEPLAFVGKRRSIGYGEVKRWLIQPTDGFSLVADGKLTRAMPAMAIHLLNGRMPEGTPAPVGWTPPQWKPALFAPGWWTGTGVTP